MPKDELRQPLRKRSAIERLWARRPSLLAAATVAVVLGFMGTGVWLVRKPYPLAGEPVVTVAIPPLEDVKTASTTAPEDQPADTEAIAANDTGSEAPPVEEIVADPEPQEANIIVAPRQSLKPAPIAAVAEASPLGDLPRIGPGGKKPSELYARFTPMGVLASDRPKIAIVLGGMGLNTKLTQKAIRELPGDVTFAFAPYGDDLQSQVNRARAQGHEILLQIPLEPVGYPANNPGPKTLLADNEAAANAEALLWHMSRFAGYTGIVNYMGGRFLASPAGLQPVLAEMKKRGLLFLEDGSLPLSSTEAVAKIVGLPARRARTVIDASPDRAAIDAALKQLEAEAAANGFAIGTGAGLEVTIEAVADWAKELDSKGIILVPVSAAYKGRAS